jgi:hypothetical protein
MRLLSTFEPFKAQYLNSKAVEDNEYATNVTN